MSYILSKLDEDNANVELLMNSSVFGKELINLINSYLILMREDDFYDIANDICKRYSLNQSFKTFNYIVDGLVDQMQDPVVADTATSLYEKYTVVLKEKRSELSQNAADLFMSAANAVLPNEINEERLGQEIIDLKDRTKEKVTNIDIGSIVALVKAFVRMRQSVAKSLADEAFDLAEEFGNRTISLPNLEAFYKTLKEIEDKCFNTIEKIISGHKNDEKIELLLLDMKLASEALELEGQGKKLFDDMLLSAWRLPSTTIEEKEELRIIRETYNKKHPKVMNKVITKA